MWWSDHRLHSRPHTHTHTHRQSVRYRASLRNKNPVPKSSHKSLSPLTQSPARSLSPIHAAHNEPSSSPRHNPPIPSRPPHDNTSPISSDSEPETQKRMVYPRSPKPIKKALQSRIRKFERRGSESSSDNSNPPTPKKLPGAPPRKHSNPEIRLHSTVFQKLHAKSHSMDEAEEDMKYGEKPLPSPQRSSKAEFKNNHLRKIPHITEDLLKDESDEPSRPPRPRGSEIRRAKERSRSVSPNPPRKFSMQALLEEGGDDVDSDISSVISVSSRSSKESGVTSRAPPYRKPRKHTSNSAMETFTPSLLPPPVPRRRSTSDSDALGLGDAVAPPLSAPPERPQSTSNPLNQQMADTLIKYILASEDPQLKSKLREIITSDPDVMKAIGSDRPETNSYPLTSTNPERAPRNSYSSDIHSHMLRKVHEEERRAPPPPQRPY